jgi:hypothetical protein
MVLPALGPPANRVVRPRGKPPPLISSMPVMPVGALVGTSTRGDRTDFILFPVGSINSATAMAAGNTHPSHELQFVRPIVADARPGGARPGLYQALPWRDGRITSDRDLDPIDASAGYIRRRGRKRQILDCLQTRATSCRDMEWSWRQITRQKSRQERRKTGFVQGNGHGSLTVSIRFSTVAVCAVNHIQRSVIRPAIYVAMNDWRVLNAGQIRNRVGRPYRANATYIPLNEEGGINGRKIHLMSLELTRGEDPRRACDSALARVRGYTGGLQSLHSDSRITLPPSRQSALRRFERPLRSGRYDGLG